MILAVTAKSTERLQFFIFLFFCLIFVFYRIGTISFYGVIKEKGSPKIGKPLKI